MVRQGRWLVVLAALLSAPAVQAGPDATVDRQDQGCSQSCGSLVADLGQYPAGSESSGAEMAASCSCALPGNYTCSSSCLTCATQSVSCDCWTGCTAGGCPTGYLEMERKSCGVLSDKKCRRLGTQIMWYCGSCPPGRYGIYCDVCSSCNGQGTCHEGAAGDGLCTCNPGYTGPLCQYSDAATCNGHGRAQYDGTCVCSTGYAGPSCRACAPNHFNYPSCTYCSASTTCNGHGSCDSRGSCVCAPGYPGPNCTRCATGPESSCANSLDDDCDQLVDCADWDCCQDSFCAGSDLDGDTYARCDCDDANNQVWATPGEPLDFSVDQDAAGTLLSWAAPINPGSHLVSYQTLRAARPSDFYTTVSCLQDSDPADLQARETETPCAGAAFFYLVRAVNGCPLGSGLLGTDSSGHPRTGSCP